MIPSIRRLGAEDREKETVSRWRTLIGSRERGEGGFSEGERESEK